MNAQKFGFILILYFPLTYRAQQQNNAEPTCSMAGISLLIVLLIFILFFIALFMILLWKRRELKLFGWILRLERHQTSEKNEKTATKGELRNRTEESRLSARVLTTLEPQKSVGASYRYIGESFSGPSDTESQINIDLNSEINHGFRESPGIAKEQGSLYENQVLEHERSQRSVQQSGRDTVDSGSYTSLEEIECKSENSDHSNPDDIHKSSKSNREQSKMPTDIVTAGRFCYENQVLEHERSNMVPYEDLKIERESNNAEYDGLRF